MLEFFSKNNRELRRYRRIVKKINALEPEMQSLSTEDLQSKTEEFRKRLSDGQTINDILVDVFAVAREAAVRILNMRHYDVQLIGGIVLHEGRIAEMRTGEGKTLVATLPVYLNALVSKGVHVVTVNDYLAQRDADWMRPLYEFLGMSVGSVYSRQPMDEKKAAYQCDIVYATNNELGFDYLRDNMVFSLDQKTQRPLYYAVIDEVDSILIDEARTPLIISGAAENSSLLYEKINQIPSLLKEQTFVPKPIPGTRRVEEVPEDEVGDFIRDEKTKQVELTEQGHQKVEELLERFKLLENRESLYAAQNLNLLHHVNTAIRAHVMYSKDVDYIVQEGEVVIVDEHTGRTMPGRRWSDGLHQAIEAKEKIKIQNENQTLASTTFQNYFRMYYKLSGMTGTADTEATEFRQIYGLDVVVIPTNRPIQRNDLNDLVYMTQEEKFDAVIKDVKTIIETGAPVLVGTANIDNSELLSRKMKAAGISHQVLNAKQHQREADVVAQAGRPSTVTIATNMAGRGTDIVLGGNLDVELSQLDNPRVEEKEQVKEAWKKRNEIVKAAGGLHILGSERHESRRIDNQLRGRCGRQGDPGVTRFYLSLEDNLMRIFAGDTMRNMMQRVGMEKGEALEFGMLSRSIERAQRKVESHNFDIRKQLLEYDDIANEQRKIVYQQRDDLLASESISHIVEAMRQEEVDKLVDRFIPPQSIDDNWDIDGLERVLVHEYRIQLDIVTKMAEHKSWGAEELKQLIIEELNHQHVAKAILLGNDENNQPRIEQLEKHILLQILDRAWKEHLLNMTHLRRGIGLRGYAQKNPKQEYKRESFEMFQIMLDDIQTDFIKVLSAIEIQPQAVEEIEEQRRQQAQRELTMQHENSDLGVEDEAKQVTNARLNQKMAEKPETYVRDGEKIGRNDPCPCGSGKKYKQCHGKLA